MTETKTETMTTMPLPDQNPMVRSLSNHDALVTPMSCGGGPGNNGNGTAAVVRYVSIRWNIMYVISTL